MNTLLELAERCEAATGSGRCLDVEIGLAVDWSHPSSGSLRYLRDVGNTVQDIAEDAERHTSILFQLPRYTASLDAAMALVPEGWDGGLYLATDTHKPEVQLETPAMRLAFSTDEERAEGSAVTLPLALCAAALRARVAIAENPC